MIQILRPDRDPFRNLAIEEYVLKHIDEDVMMLWQSEDAVVVGKHQNTVAEVNQRFVFENNIPVIRRLSGGGTVFHDEGNLNYSIVTTVDNKERAVDFKKFTDPIIRFLKKFGLDASFHGKTNLGINGLKFSGNAAHVYKNRVLHHGTLLFNTNIEKLKSCIMPSEAEVTDKSIKSVRASIVNLIDLIPEINTMSEFKEQLKQFLFEDLFITDSLIFSANEHEKIEKLVTEKYSTIEWNYGYSPTYQYTKSSMINGKNVAVWFEVRKGIIVDLRIQSDTISERMNGLIRHTMINSLHHPEIIIKNLREIDHDLKTINMDSKFISTLIF